MTLGSNRWKIKPDFGPWPSGGGCGLPQCCYYMQKHASRGRNQDDGRIFRLLATTALAHPQTARGSHSPAKAVDAADVVCLQHRLLRAPYGFLAAPPRIGAVRASTGGRRKKM
ncbi:hypothetical protein NDU88_000207 [Pleurodeles waltl]|uniref:Uncharacterized protein n=1 Tax=Pleurodeles waltl TaxID=8319 RepID=A0AAV7S505_PLEWA|nr:hypothetical protein NDU88_000207 [Pleurodeles waltl]